MQQEHNDSTAAISTENGTRTRPIHRGLQAVALLAAVALAAGLIASPPLASMSAVVLASTCIFLVLLNLGRSRERTVARALHRKMTIGDAARRAGTRAALRIGIALMLATAVVAAISLDRTTVAAGVAFVLAAFTVLGAPAWLAAVGDEEEATTTALTRSGSTPPAIGRREAEERNP
jgi:hypothetical protein